MDPVFPDKTSPAGSMYFYTKSAILNRAQSALQDLYKRPEKLIVVVSHSAFLRIGMTGKTWANGDYRIFDFCQRGSDNEPYRLLEWDTTAKGGGMGLSATTDVELGARLPEE